MSYVERMRTVETVVRQVDGRVPVIAGTGANSTETAITLSKDAALAGVDGLLVVTPFYNKATQRGLIRHYETIADAVDRPMILYNVPSRTGVKCAAETYAALSRHPNIQGVKEASGDFALIQKTRELCPEDFYIWSGNDDETAPIMLLGGVGVISVAANVVPREMRALTPRLPGRGLCHRRQAPAEAPPALRGPVLGGEPHPRQDRPGHDGPLRGAAAPAPVRDGAWEPGAALGRAGGVRTGVSHRAHMGLRPIPRKPLKRFDRNFLRDGLRRPVSLHHVQGQQHILLPPPCLLVSKGRRGCQRRCVCAVHLDR